MPNNNLKLKIILNFTLLFCVFSFTFFASTAFAQTTPPPEGRYGTAAQEQPRSVDAVVFEPAVIFWRSLASGTQEAIAYLRPSQWKYRMCQLRMRLLAAVAEFPPTLQLCQPPPR